MRPGPASKDQGRMGILKWLRKRMAALQFVVLAVKGHLSLVAIPQPVDDLNLFSEYLIPLRRRRKRESIGAVLALEPARSHAQLHPTLRYVIGGDHGLC